MMFEPWQTMIMAVAVGLIVTAAVGLTAVMLYDIWRGR